MNEKLVMLAWMKKNEYRSEFEVAFCRSKFLMIILGLTRTLYLYIYMAPQSLSIKNIGALISTSIARSIKTT